MVIPEFRYASKKGEKRSPEVLIRLGSRLLAVEAKARRVPRASSVEGRIEAIDGEFDLIAENLSQVSERMTELVGMKTLPLGGLPEVDLTGIEEVHLMVVTMGEFPLWSPLSAKLRKSSQANSNFRWLDTTTWTLKNMSYSCLFFSGTLQSSGPYQIEFVWPNINHSRTSSSTVRSPCACQSFSTTACPPFWRHSNKSYSLLVRSEPLSRAWL